MSTINFQWDLTEENFRRMMAHEQTTDVFGSVRFGLILVEFRCNEEGTPIVDMFVYGKNEADYPYTDNYLSDGTPFLLLDDMIPVPARRSIDNFKVAFELRVMDWLNGDGKIHYTEAIQNTISRKSWEFEDDEPKPQADKLCVETMLGTLTAERIGGSDYPGFWVYLERNGKKFEFALLEVDQNDWGEDNCTPKLAVHVYNTTDNDDEDPNTTEFSAEQIKNYMNEH